MSIPVKDGTAWYGKQCEPVKIINIGSYAKEGWVSHILTLMVLCGSTYIETSAHLYPDGITLADIAPEFFLRRAFIVHLPKGKRILPCASKPPSDFRKKQDALLLASGWDEKSDEADYYAASPYFSKDLQEFILELSPAILGGDMLSFDAPDDDSQPFLHKYFHKGGIILVPLVGLGKVPKEVVTLCAAPLKLEKTCAAPCRALCW
ncbi:MAG: cyclase family protein [Planctomycetota bacterium]